MVYSSSLMESNLFVVRRKELVRHAVEEARKIKTIEQLNKVRVWWWWGTHVIIEQLNKVRVWWGWGTHMIIEQLN